ncbi:MAG: mannitol dehydrogenase [Clostridia bacterium]|jgi:mannitol-1-phosphate 5-dehydrogenase|nr:mannitol dehydrogenase [Clostridia bacterium]MBT7123267.1 mannitol dehydrogenase [Clostridia bacterium]
MKNAVMYGAGNIGRGFIGKVFSESGMDVVFIDVVQEVIDKLNEENEYPVRLVSNEIDSEVIVKNASAVSGFDQSAVTEAIINADIMATAVGVNILPRIVDNIAAGLDARAQAGKPPFDIIICENLIDADKYLRGMLEEKVLPETREYLSDSVGLVEASIGRMVPVMTDEMRGDNILRVVVEPYEELPVDKDAFRGQIPPLNNLVPFSPFGFYIRRKLFVHNMGHAICAYFGWMKGYEFVYESAEDEEIASKAKAAMLDAAAALSKGYGIPFEEIEANVYDLIRRFGNRVLKDTNARVGGDPIRKLKSIDRLAGSALYCIEQGLGADNIISAIAAGYCFDNPEDTSAIEIQQFIAENGIEEAVRKYSGIDGELLSKVVDEYRKLRS